MTCKCYTDVSFGKQVCGTKKGDLIMLSPPECCPGGCTGEPYGYGKIYNVRVFTRLAFILLVTGITLLTYLKISRPVNV